MDTLKEFEVRSAGNGGVMVRRLHQDSGRISEIVGAFTTPVDMITWLAAQYGLHAQLSRVVDGGTVRLAVSVNEGEEHHHRFKPKPSLMGEKALFEQRLVPRGTPKADDGWINWGGSNDLAEIPFPAKKMVNMRLRDGGTITDCAGSYRWLWMPGDDLRNDDVVAYRVAPSVDDGWIEWSGYQMLDTDKGLPCRIRMRDGKERVGKTFDLDRRWYWARNDELIMNDVIAYRLV